MAQIKNLLREAPLLCRLGFHWREWTATARMVDLVPQARLPWFQGSGKVLEAKLHTSTGKCKRCNDMLVYYTVYEVEDSL